MVGVCADGQGHANVGDGVDEDEHVDERKVLGFVVRSAEESVFACQEAGYAEVVAEDLFEDGCLGLDDGREVVSSVAAVAP